MYLLMNFFQNYSSEEVVDSQEISVLWSVRVHYMVGIGKTPKPPFSLIIRTKNKTKLLELFS